MTSSNAAAAAQRPARFSEAEWQVRVDLAACYRLIPIFGWEDMIFTHISARVPGDEDHFLINPYGMLFQEITASSLVKVDKDGNIVDPGETGQVNPAGFTIHSAVHMARPEVGAVLHLHAADGVAVSIHPEGLMPLSQTALLVHKHVAYHEFEGVALNLDERERLVRDLGDKNVMLLRNHGTLTVGRDVPEAFTWTYYLMKACEIQVKALLGGKPHMPSAEAIATTHGQSDGLPMVAPMLWKAALRLVDQKLPGYAQ